MSKALQDKIQRYEAAREQFDPKRYKRGGGYSPDDIKSILRIAGMRSAPTNEDRAAVELWKFEKQKTAPVDISGYVKDGRLTTFTGAPFPGVERLRVTHTERLRNNPYSTERLSYETSYRGHTYAGRGYGNGMSLVLKKRA